MGRIDTFILLSIPDFFYDFPLYLFLKILGFAEWGKKSNRKNGQKIWTGTSQKRIVQKLKNNIKKCSTLAVIREIQVKNAMRCQYEFIKIAEISRANNAEGEDLE